MKTVTSVTVFNDAVGLRMSVTYSEVNEESGRIISDNNRIDRVVTSSSARTDANSLMTYAQTFVDNIE